MAFIHLQFHNLVKPEIVRDISAHSLRSIDDVLQTPQLYPDKSSVPYKYQNITNTIQILKKEKCFLSCEIQSPPHLNSAHFYLSP